MSSSQTIYRNKRVQFAEEMLVEILRVNRMKKIELERIPMPWFNWMLKSLQTKTIQIPKEIKKQGGKPRKNEMRFYQRKGERAE